MQPQSLAYTWKRYSSLYTHKISALPIAILMPHSACNCRCVMCDIWKGNKNSKQLSEADISALLDSLKKLGTRRIVMSGGEALLNRNFFTFCELIRKEKISITLLSTGMTVARHAENILALVDDVIVSLDGDEPTHNTIRNIPNAYSELKAGVQTLKQLKPGYPVAARSVIHRLNYKVWDKLILAAREIGFDSISFLPADVTSEAFNRAEPWEKEQQENVLVPLQELDELHRMLQHLKSTFSKDFSERFIVESPEKLQKIHQYYAAHHGLASFPDKNCNAPWVSVVVEADGSVRPCFFHDVIGSVKDKRLDEIVNRKEVIAYRKNLNVHENPTCQKCVCYLNLQPRNRHY